MKNKDLAIAQGTASYVKELRRLPSVNSASAAILMRQLDYWFSQYPNGFCKYLKPNRLPDYRVGDSWEEELEFSEREFRTAFSHIGQAYKSKNDFDSSSDIFNGKFYCSYYDRGSNKTFYFRNHDLVDSLLDTLPKH